MVYKVSHRITNMKFTYNSNQISHRYDVDIVEKTFQTSFPDDVMLVMIIDKQFIRQTHFSFETGMFQRSYPMLQ